jgi:uncharacterized protein DUF3891
VEERFARAHNNKVEKREGPATQPLSFLSDDANGEFRGIAAFGSSAMIIQEKGDQLVLIRQTDHAALCGLFAREWGNDQFVRPQPFESFCRAAGEHDNGWHEWELLPKLDLKTRLPYSFTSIPTEEHMALYHRGIERLVRIDRYAGLLVSMHCAGLYDRARATMPGFSAKYVKSSEAQLVSDFVQQLRLQQLRLKVDLRADAATQDFADEKALQVNYQRLEALDRLSLYFCLAPLGDATIDAVPKNDAGYEVDWEVRPEKENRVSLVPYPFRKDPLEFNIMFRRIPKRVYADDLDLQKTLARAPYQPMKFTLRAGEVYVEEQAGAA